MSTLTHAQHVILSSAARRNDGAVLPLPKTLKLNKGSATRVIKSLLQRRVVAEVAVTPGVAAWRRNQTGDRIALTITDAGRKVVGVKANQGPGTQSASGQSEKERRNRTVKSASDDTSRNRALQIAGRKGTKLALLRNLLDRKEGATIAEAVKATGWQAHSVRGAISGMLKKKLGLPVKSETVAGRGRVYRIAGRG